MFCFQFVSIAPQYEPFAYILKVFMDEHPVKFGLL